MAEPARKGRPPRHLVAVDGGGSGCRALVADAAGRVLGRAGGGPANINSDFDGALANILVAVETAAADAGLAPETLPAATAVLGLAGANVGDNAARIMARLPFAASAIHSDAVIAMRGALGAHDGVAAIVGTGSVFMARQGGEARSIGGWGFAVGDLGSGARIGQALLERVLLAYDGIRPSSPLAARILRRFDDEPGRVVTFAGKATPGDFAAFAPLVFDAAHAADAVAAEVARKAVRDIEQALDAAMPPGCDRLCLLGGLSALVAPRLGERYRAILREPLGDPLSGALAMALEQAGESEASVG